MKPGQKDVHSPYIIILVTCHRKNIKNIQENLKKVEKGVGRLPKMW
jgi:hypothetical protein